MLYRPTSDRPSVFGSASVLLVAMLLLSLSMSSPIHGQDPHEGHEGHEGHEHGHEGHGHGEEHVHGAHGDGDLHAPGFHHDFGDAERWARIFDAPERVEWQQPQAVVELMALEPGMSVVDIGAGTGFFLGYLSMAVGPEGRVHGLDVAEEMVGHMRERIAEAGWSNAEARAVAPDDPGLGEGTTDRILIVNTWHHIDDRPVYGAKLARALRDGGALYVVDYTLESEVGPPKAHRLPPERVVKELEAAGFEARILEEGLPRQYVVEARPAD